MVTSSDRHDLRRGPVAAEPRLLLALSADLTAAAEARKGIDVWLSGHGWPVAAQEDLVLAVSEAVSNAVEHGYGVRPGVAARDGLVEVVAEVLRDGRVEITVRDHGGWRPTPPERGHRRHGIPIMQACTAECAVEGTSSGTTVVLRSHRA